MKDWWTGRTTLSECDRYRMYGPVEPMDEGKLATRAGTPVLASTGQGWWLARWFAVFFVGTLVFIGV